MRSKKFTGLIALAVCAVFVSFCAFPASATDSRYLASNWQQYTNATATNELGFTLSPNILGNNCFGFASLVVRHMNSVEVRGYDTDMRLLYGPWIKGIGSLSGKGDSEVRKIVGSYLGNGNNITTEDVKTAFANASIGDWIQMVRGSSQHSAIISDLYENGFEVLHSNWNGVKIENTYFSYENFANQCRQAGSKGGFTINHFGEPVPDDLPWDGPSVLLHDGGDDCIKVYTLENRTYDVYSDKFLRNKMSSNWTDGSEEDYILGVGKNSEGVYYLRISIPTNSGRKTVYVNRDVFLAGFINESNTIYKDCNEFYRRRGSGYDSSYWARVADGAIFPLARDSQWVQVLFWDSGSNGGRRIAWLTRSKYDEITTNPNLKAPAITTTSMPNGFVGESYTATINATGSTPIYFEINASAWSRGLICDIAKATDGQIQITGTPRTEGALTVKVTARNSVGSVTKDFPVVFTNNGGGPKITTENLPNAIKGQYYSAPINAKWGVLPFNWVRDSGIIPSGLSLSSSSNRTVYLSGTPTETGTYTFKVSAEDGTSPNFMHDTKSFTITVTDAIAPSITTSNYSEFTAYKGEAFSQSFSATGTTPITWSISAGSLPSGLSINSSTGKITGTPTAAGVKNFYVEAKNSAGSSSILCSIIVEEKPTISGTFIDGTDGVSYSSSVSVSGGVAPYTWTITSGTRPTNTSLSSSGSTATLSGTPKAGSYSFTLKVTDTNGFSATKTFTIKVLEKPIITTSNTYSWTAYKGEAFSQSLSATGTTPITWSISSGSLPSGLSINSSTGTISGTPTSTGTYNPVVKATNTAGYVTKTFTIKVVEKPTITTSNASTFTAYKGETFTQSLTATGTTPITWSISSGSLPSGLSINSSTGTISGTPTSTGTYNPVVKATNTAGYVTKTFTIKVVEKPTITTSNTSTWTAYKGEAFTQSLSATGTTPITWSISSGSLPSGLSINSSTGTISGTPTSTGTYNPTVKATNTAGYVTKIFTIKVVEKPTITTSNTYSFTAYKGETFTQSLTATGTTPITWSISSGSLPSGMTINSSTGTISGTPTSTGTYNPTVKATNTAGYVTKTFPIKVVEKPTINGTFSNGTDGVSYSSSVSVSGGVAPYTWTITSGTRPTNTSLSYSGTTATLSGTPKAGTYPFTLKVTDNNGKYATNNFTITIAEPAEKPSITTSNTSTFTAYKGETFSRSLSATGTTPITWSISSGSLPSGLSINSSTGTISGTPTSTGTYTPTVKATNTADSDTKTFTIKVVEKPTISGTFSNGTDGVYYSSSVSVSGGVAPYTWTITNGTRPTNTSLSYSGTTATLSGTPKAGTYPFTLKVTDTNGKYTTKSFSITIAAPLGLKIDSTNFPDSVFRNYVSKHFDSDSNGYLSDSEIANIGTIDVYGTGISSLKGIEYFTKLTSLNCSSNDISELDVSNNTKLEYLYCSKNTKITELDLTKNTALKKLDVTGCSNLFKDDIYCDSSVEITGSDIVTPDIEIPVAMPEFRGATLILEGQIGVNFYMSLPEGYDYSNSDKYYVEFDIRGGTSNKEPRQIYNPNFKIVSNGETLYGFRCYINSAQMAEKITANFHFDGTIISNDDSVDDYLNRVINKNYPEKTRNLMNAIRDYGHYAQLMLSKANGWTIGERYAEMPAATEYTDADIAEARTNAAPYAVSAYKNSSGISRMGVSLNLDSETTLNISFTPADNYNGSVSATVDGKAYDSNILNRDRKVQIENIPANDLGKMYTVMLEANGVNTVNASALSYVSIVFNQTGSSMGNVDMDTMRRAVTALYRYYAATRAYFGTGE